ncbi:MAG: hypothetical protein U0625_09780 [Phycisphaerales bacterium]
MSGIAITVAFVWLGTLEVEGQSATSGFDVLDASGDCAQAIVSDNFLYSTVTLTHVNTSIFLSEFGFRARMQAQWKAGGSPAEQGEDALRREEINLGNRLRVQESQISERLIRWRPKLEERALHYDALPGWFKPQLGLDAEGNTMWTDQFVAAVGWPMRCAIRSDRRSVLCSTPPYYAIEVAGSRLDPAVSQSSDDLPPSLKGADGQRLSIGGWLQGTEIFWPGLVTNILAWSLATALVPVAVRFLRGKFRQRRGQCAACGHALHGAGVCNECGRRVRGVPVS